LAQSTELFCLLLHELSTDSWKPDKKVCHFIVSVLSDLVSYTSCKSTLTKQVSVMVTLQTCMEGVGFGSLQANTELLPQICYTLFFQIRSHSCTSDYYRSVQCKAHGSGILYCCRLPKELNRILSDLYFYDWQFIADHMPQWLVLLLYVLGVSSWNLDCWPVILKRRMCAFFSSSGQINKWSYDCFLHYL
jgi:hypothetical protein